MRLPTASLAFLVLALPPQDQPPRPQPTTPQPTTPQPPEGAAPLPQIPDLPMTEIERKDLWQRFGTPSPIAGTYRLKAAARRGQIARGSVQGYMFVGQRYLSIQIHDASASPGKPAIQAAVREYRLTGTRLQTTSRLGVRVPPGDDPVLDGEGLIEMRDIQITSTALRVVQGQGDYLEFERIE